LFLTSSEDEALARRPEHVERLARALAGGFADYLARTPLDDEEEAS
jgi:N-acetylmuramoyl-L-alanine amidase